MGRFDFSRNLAKLRDRLLIHFLYPYSLYRFLYDTYYRYLYFWFVVSDFLVLFGVLVFCIDCIIGFYFG